MIARVPTLSSRESRRGERATSLGNLGTIRTGEKQRDVVGAGAHQRRPDDRKRVAGTVSEALKLVEHDDKVVGD